jgi:signal transduction histidine kinase
MALSIGFSIVFYRVSMSSLFSYLQAPDGIAPSKAKANSDDSGQVLKINEDGKPLENTPLSTTDIEVEFKKRAAIIRSELQHELLALNIGALVVGSMLSLYLARRTLRPIEAAMEAQSRFASDASHELRTPLTIMLAENEEGLTIRGLQPQARELIKSNLEEIARLRELSDGLLQLARSDKTSDPRPIWADEIGTEAINRIFKVAQTKRIVIDDLWPRIQIIGDAQTLTQATLILLDNAIKYSQPRTTIHLEATPTNKHIQLRVRDEGIGIAKQSLPHIFDRLYRADQSRAKHHASGYGLGLSIAQKLITQQGGTLQVDSALGQGSTFIITLPLYKK